MWNEAVWKNGPRTIKGHWRYLRHVDRFFICLDSTDPVTGQKRQFETSNDTPEWGKWKLVEEQHET